MNIAMKPPFSELGKNVEEVNFCVRYAGDCNAQELKK